MTIALWLADSAVKVSALLAVALVVLAALRGRSAAARHFVLATAIGCALLAPAATLILPAWSIALPSAGPAPAAADAPSATVQIAVDGDTDARARRAAAAVAPSAAVRLSLGAVLVGVWVLGALACLTRLVIGVGRLAWLTSRSRAVTDGTWTYELARLARDRRLRREVRVLQSEHPTLLVTWGHRRPVILLPREAASWSADRARIVLSHELAHVATSDWTVRIAAEILRSLHWFNPLAWTAVARLRLESELACDDAVIRSGADGCDYATHLLDLARDLGQARQAGWPAPAMARRSSLERRISAMVDRRRNRRKMTRAARAATLAAWLGVTLPIAAAQSAGGTLSGRVVDSTGRPVANASVTLTPSGGTAVSQPTDADGQYRFDNVTPGQYDFAARSNGFRQNRAALFLDGRGAARLDVSLAIGALSEELTVTAGGGRTAGPDLVAVAPSPEQAQRMASSLQSFDARRAACVAGPAGGDIIEPRKIMDVKPIYPAGLAAGAVGGVVVLKGTVSTEGEVTDVAIVGDARPELAAAAIDAVRQWRFTPTLLNCDPIAVEVTVTINFTTGS